MKKEIAILGSTGSVGSSLLNIIKKDKKNFQVVLLTANKNYKKLLIQAKKFNVKYVIITNNKIFELSKQLFIKNKIQSFNNFNQIDQILKKKIFYSMCSIVGLEGLEPTIKIIKYSKNIAIANKEAIICGWKIIEKNLKKNKTKFIPVDSEHFSIWKSIVNEDTKYIKKIFLTASGGPFLKRSLKKMEKINISDAINHPNWKMGKKISVDSSTMMNKVFEIIEARNIFNLPFSKLDIIVHPKSYVHALILNSNGLIQIVAHDTTMEVPLFNSLYQKNEKTYVSKKIDLNILNDLKLQKVNLAKYPLVNILTKIPKNQSLFDVVLVSANDELVNLFLENKIKYNDIAKNLLKIIFLKDFQKYRKIKTFKIKDITKLDKYVRLKVNSFSI